MEPLIVLIAVFVLSLIISKLVTRQPKLIFSGNIAMSAIINKKCRITFFSHSFPAHSVKASLH